MGSNLAINEEIEKYINEHSLNLDPIQKEIISYNNSLGDIKKMQISISQCHFLHLIIKTSKIKRILEIGTFTGLSTLSMSLALPKNGHLIALDKNENTSKVAKVFFKKAKQDYKIKLIVKSALESLNDLKHDNEKFDFIFIDADKENYKNYYDLSLNLIEKNGLIVIDNVLWHGEVINKKNQDRLTVNIRNFNSYVNSDKRTENLIIPIGDGLTVCRKL
tara:strand:- start:361 stop:1017 length:657 start_codon:yes stop_codon:yes gene_type:complete